MVSNQSKIISHFKKMMPVQKNLKKDSNESQAKILSAVASIYNIIFKNIICLLMQLLHEPPSFS